MVKNVPPALQDTWIWSLSWEDSPGGGHDNPLQYSYLENPHGQRSLVGYSPWGHKESDTTERLSTAQHRCFKAPICRFTKTCLPADPKLCKDTPRTHCTIPWEKRSRESVLWVSTAISVVTLRRWNCTVRWLPRKKWQVAWFFKKAQILDQRCFYEEKNEPRCFSISIEAAIFQLSQEENIAFANGPQCPGSEKHDSLQFLS